MKTITKVGNKAYEEIQNLQICLYSDINEKRESFKTYENRKRLGNWKTSLKETSIQLVISLNKAKHG